MLEQTNISLKSGRSGSVWLKSKGRHGLQKCSLLTSLKSGFQSVNESKYKRVWLIQPASFSDTSAHHLRKSAYLNIDRF